MRVDEVAEEQAASNTTSGSSNETEKDGDAEVSSDIEGAAAEGSTVYPNDPQPTAVPASTAEISSEIAADVATKGAVVAGSPAPIAVGGAASDKVVTQVETTKVNADSSVSGETTQASQLAKSGERGGNAKVPDATQLRTAADSAGGDVIPVGKAESKDAIAALQAASQRQPIDSATAKSETRGNTSAAALNHESASKVESKEATKSQTSGEAGTQKRRIVQTSAVSASSALAEQAAAKPETAKPAPGGSPSEVAKTITSVPPMSADQANRPVNPVPLEISHSPIREKFAARRAAAEQITSATSSPTVPVLPQGAYSAASFGLGAGALTAATPNTTSSIAIDSLTSVGAGGASQSGGMIGAELPGLSQLLTEATVSPGTVHKPETPRLIANQMAEALATKGERNVDVALNPKELGHVNMRVSVTDVGVSVMIQTERAETGDLMRRHINELADEFRRMGFDDISFQFSGDEASNRGGGNDASQGNPGRSAGSGSSDELAETAAEPIAQSLNLGEVGLDIRV
ncbi:flagellar hook-length control protein FliK [Phaeobacter porticola]|nr:flagellar hook-length control protein FliK [Phaeobacter porticola]